MAKIPKATLIISVYKDVEALNCSLIALQDQTGKDFEVIVTEDGQSDEITSYIAKNKNILPNLRHLTQEDRGFRKTKAVNRAIDAAKADYLIFIDGDCIPHRTFINTHLQNREENAVCVARRVHLGPRASKLVRRFPAWIKIIENPFLYLLLTIPLHMDKIRNYEIGFASKLIHKFTKHRYLDIVGCNFSCYKDDILKINGYNEDLLGAGGEDNDLGWRFNCIGVHEKSIKFITPVYHLYHPYQRVNVEENLEIINEAMGKKRFFCMNGIIKGSTTMTSQTESPKTRPIEAPNDVSIIIINFNSSDHTLACVDSILKNTNNSAFNYNIVIVDNNSATSDYENLSVLHKHVAIKIVRSRVNLGFSAGYMFGLQFTRAKYYFFLNNDCRFLNDCLTPLFNFCSRNENVGICTPQLYSENGEVQKSLDYFPTISSKILGTSLLRLFKKEKYPDRKIVYKHPLKVDLVSGSALFVNAIAFNAIGGFDTIYFLYCEEEDLALRLSKVGYDVYLVPDAHNLHYGGGSTPNTDAIREEFYISFLYFYRKHYGLFKTQLLKIILFIKIARKLPTSYTNLSLAFFILSGAHLKHSLRHKQQISNSDIKENLVAISAAHSRLTV